MVDESIPYQYQTASGEIIPDTGNILTDVQTEFKNAFGSDLIVTPDTPQGVLIVAETLARTAVVNNNAMLANQINPNLAGGIFLDAIMALMGIQRNPLTYSTAPCNLTGVPGTLIPSGSLAKETVNGEVFQSTQDITLASNGTGSVVFQAVNGGPITAAMGTLTQIVSNILGWETITNTAAATLGSETQSDLAARLYRLNTLATQGSSLAQAITSAVYAVPNVFSLSFRENIANTTEVIDGVTMTPHSIYLCVDGGTDVDVANAIISKKSGGAAYNNGPAITHVDQLITVPFSGQEMHVLFDRPNIIQIIVRATIRLETSVQNPDTAVKQAILDYVAGKINGEQGLTVGMNVSSFELSGAVNQQVTGIYVQNMEISKASPISYSNAEIAINIWEKATIVEGSITVVIL